MPDPAPVESPAPIPPPAPPQGRVHVRLSSGQVGTVDASDVPGVIDDGGAIATSEEVHKATLEAQYGGLGGAAVAGGLGLARGLTATMSDPALVALGGEKARQYIEGHKEVHPITSAVTEGAGMLLPLIASDGATGVLGGVRAAGVAPRAIAGAGRLAEEAVARVVGEGATSVAGKLAQGAARMGAQGATEGALWNVGNQISEDSLGGHDVTAEKLFAAAGKGALFGGGVGSVLGAGGAALGIAGTKLGDLAGSAMGDTKLGAQVQRIADENAFKSTGAKIGDWKKLGSDAEGMADEGAAIGRTMNERGITAPEGSLPIGPSKRVMAERVNQQLDEVGADLGRMRKELDRATETRFSVQDFAKRVDEELVRPMSQQMGTDGAIASVAKHMEEFIQKAGERPTFERVWELRKNFDEKVLKWEKLNPTEATQASRQMRGILEDELTKKGARASAEIGSDFAQKYQLTKDVYGNLAEVKNILSREVGREQFTNRAISLTDTIAGSNLATAGALMHGPVGAAIGLAGGLANKVMRERSNQTIAFLLNKASQLQAIQSASLQIDRKVASGVAGMLERKATTFGSAAASSPVESLEATEKRIADVRAMADNPAMLAKRTAHTFDAASSAPKTTEAFNAQAQKAVTYLASKAPKQAPPMNLLQPNASKLTRAPTSEVSAWGRVYRAVNDPMSVLEDARHGKVSREALEAVKEVYPNLHEQIVQEVLKQVPHKAGALDWEQRKTLSIVLGVPVDQTFKPEFVQAIQAAKDAPPVEAPPAPGSGTRMGGKRPAKADESLETPLQQLTK